MARLMATEVQAIYRVADQWIDGALRTDGSLFTPGRPVWTETNVDDLVARFVRNPDLGQERFNVKLKKQLAGASDAVCQLAAEVLLVHLLVIADWGGETKKRLIHAALSCMAEPVLIPDGLNGALDVGLLHPGTFFHTNIDRQVSYDLFQLGNGMRRRAELPDAESHQ